METSTLRAGHDGLSRACGHGLTHREHEVLELLAQGHTSAGIARRLGISPRTSQKHLEHVYVKLDCHDRLLAVLRAVRLGLVDDVDVT